MDVPQHTRRLYDAVQITADNTDAFDGRLGENPPPWARYALVGLVCVDTDWTLTVFAAGQEWARAAAPSRVAADNIDQNIDFSNTMICIPIGKGSNFDLICNVNVVTGAAGIVYVVYLG